MTYTHYIHMTDGSAFRTQTDHYALLLGEGDFVKRLRNPDHRFRTDDDWAIMAGSVVINIREIQYIQSTQVQS